MEFVAEPVLRILPIWLRIAIAPEDLSKIFEIRLRVGQAAQLVTAHGNKEIGGKISVDDLLFCVNVASKYSPWKAASIFHGYITIEGGHRVGITGCWTVDESGKCSVGTLNSICIRIAKDYPGISGLLYQFPGSLLILGKPGSGKTTLLRDLIRKASTYGCGSVSVVDERSELFPYNCGKLCFFPGNHTDVISGCSKKKGIEMAIRCMGPNVVAVDEITSKEDCETLIEAGWCGVKIFATAHAHGSADLFKRPVYKPIVDSGLFQGIVVMNEDKSWNLERV